MCCGLWCHSCLTQLPPRVQFFISLHPAWMNVNFLLQETRQEFNQTTANDNIYSKFSFLNDSVTDYSMPFILPEQDSLNLIKKVLDCRLYTLCIKHVRYTNQPKRWVKLLHKGRKTVSSRATKRYFQYSFTSTDACNQHTNKNKKQSQKEDVLVKLPMFALIYKVVKTLSDLS